MPAAAKLKEAIEAERELREKRIAKAREIVSGRPELQVATLGALPSDHVWAREIRTPGKPLPIEAVREGPPLIVRKVAQMPDSAASLDHPSRRLMVQDEKIWYLTHPYLKVL